MSITLKKIFYSILLNSSLLFLLIIGIQNSSKKSKVNLLISESINLPISFVIGSSFIIGSITGSALSMNIKKKQD